MLGVTTPKRRYALTAFMSQIVGLFAGSPKGRFKSFIISNKRCSHFNNARMKAMTICSLAALPTEAKTTNGWRK